MSVPVSVVVVTYRRLARLGEVLSAWLKETSGGSRMGRAARARTLAEHTCAKRCEMLMEAIWAS